ETPVTERLPFGDHVRLTIDGLETLQHARFENVPRALHLLFREAVCRDIAEHRCDGSECVGRVVRIQLRADLEHTDIAGRVVVCGDRRHEAGVAHMTIQSRSAAMTECDREYVESRRVLMQRTGRAPSPFRARLPDVALQLARSEEHTS